MIDIENDLEKILESGKKPEEYLQTYLDLVEQCKPRGLDKSKVNFYTEIHHIVPRCKGGTNDEENLIMFSALEHMVAHILLHLAYPNDYGFILSVSAVCCMSPNIDISKENLRTLSEQRIKAFFNPVVGYSEDLSSIKVYDYVSCITRDGFNASAIVYCINGVYKKSQGYCWEKLDTFLKKYEKEIDKHNISPSLTPIVIKKSSKRKNYYRKDYQDRRIKFLCTKEDKSVVHIFNKITDLFKYGVTRAIVMDALDAEKLAYGYFWYTFDKFFNTYSDKLADFSTQGNNSSFEIKVNTAFHSRKSVICYDDNNNIIRIYDKVGGVNVDGFEHTSVSAAINRSNKSSETKLGRYAGYNWCSYDSWTDQAKIEEYHKLEEDNNLPKIKFKFKTSIVRLSEDKEIITIYSSFGSVRQDGLLQQNLFRHMKLDESKGRHSLYNGSFWYKLDEYAQQYPEKLEEYYKTHENERP